MRGVDNQGSNLGNRRIWDPNGIPAPGTGPETPGGPTGVGPTGQSQEQLQNDSSTTQGEFKDLQAGSSQATTSAPSASFPSPQEYRTFTGYDPDLYDGDISLQTTQTTGNMDLNDPFNQQMVLGIIEGLAARSPQLRDILNNAQNPTIRTLLIIAAVTILQRREKMDGLFEKMAGLDPNAKDDTEKTITTAKLTEEVRGYARDVDSFANMGRLAHEMLNNSIRKING